MSHPSTPYPPSHSPREVSGRDGYSCTKGLVRKVSMSRLHLNARKRKIRRKAKQKAKDKGRGEFSL